MYTLRSHMSVVEYTCAFHRPTTTKSSKSQVTTSSYQFSHIAKPIHFQNKTKLDSTRHRLNTLKPLD